MKIEEFLQLKTPTWIKAPFKFGAIEANKQYIYLDKIKPNNNEKYPVTFNAIMTITVEGRNDPYIAMSKDNRSNNIIFKEHIKDALEQKPDKSTKRKTFKTVFSRRK